MTKHCPVTGESLRDCTCGACEDIDYDATGSSQDDEDEAT